VRKPEGQRTFEVLPRRWVVEHNNRSPTTTPPASRASDGTRCPKSRSANPPPELRPDSGRRGPPELWEQFDTAIADLSKALEGISLAAIGRAYGDISHIARALSTTVAEQDAPTTRGRRQA